jgi:hypothetical protein
LGFFEKKMDFDDDFVDELFMQDKPKKAPEPPKKDKAPVPVKKNVVYEHESDDDIAENEKTSNHDDDDEDDDDDKKVVANRIKEEDDEPLIKNEDGLDSLTFTFNKCRLCGDKLIDPVTLPCGHNFCLSCIEGKIADAEDRHCASCSLCGSSFLEYARANQTRRIRVNHLLAATLGVIDSYVDEKDKGNGDALMTRFVDFFKTNYEIKAANGVKTAFVNLVNLDLQDQDITVMEEHIKKLTYAKQVMQMRLDSLKRVLTTEETTYLPRYIRAGLINGELIAQAKTAFALPKDVYNMIVIQTDMCDFRDDDVFARQIMSMPLRGITSERCMVLIQCISQNLDMVLNSLIRVFDLTFEGILATWVEDDAAGSTINGIGGAKKRSKGMNSTHSQLINTFKTHLFVAASLGSVRALRESNKQHKIIQIKAKPLPEVILPNELFTSLTTLFSVYTHRCLIITGSETIEANKDITMPNGWDVCRVNPSN